MPSLKNELISALTHLLPRYGYRLVTPLAEVRLLSERFPGRLNSNGLEQVLMLAAAVVVMTMMMMMTMMMKMMTLRCSWLCSLLCETNAHVNVKPLRRIYMLLNPIRTSPIRRNNCCHFKQCIASAKCVGAEVVFSAQVL